MPKIIFNKEMKSEKFKKYGNKTYLLCQAKEEYMVFDLKYLPPRIISAALIHVSHKILISVQRRGLKVEILSRKTQVAIQ